MKWKCCLIAIFVFNIIIIIIFIIDFKKVFARVWHDGMIGIIRKFNISKGNAIEALYKAYHSAGWAHRWVEWLVSFTKVGVRQVCLLLSIIFKIVLENIMTEAFDGFAGSVSMWSE